jgi:2-polyprenyl-6-hydroxyphenyl methylase / 3-demethylubiquinone-9 3-methyltransferase
VPGDKIDNDVYNRHADRWWDEDDPLNMLHGSLTPGRLAYFARVLARERGPALTGLRALDIGCGGGFLAEEFARLGCDVVGVDPSAASLETARRHALAGGLDIDYRVGTGEQLPVADGQFDLVYCCDVLEHVTDLDRVIAETARALKPGGMYLFDTVNRTLVSKVLAIKVLQDWRYTRVFDFPLHQFDMFITPRELTAVLDRHGLAVDEIVGLGPRARNPVRLLSAVVRARQGRLSYGRLSRVLDFGEQRSRAVSYMGWATKVG